MKTLVAVNTLTNVEARAYSSHCQEWFRMGKHFPEDDFIMYNPHRSGIDRTRNLAVQMALEWNADYVYFIDDDMILSPATYKRLRDADKDIVMAHTIIRGYPFNNMHFVDPQDRAFETDLKYPDHLEYFQDCAPYTEAGTELLRVDAIGCATVLFKTKIFRDIAPPWFVTTANTTEDVYFCLKAQRHYGRKGIGIYVHMGVPTAHIMDSELAYPLVREKLKSRAEEDEPLLVKPPDLGDRGTEYCKGIEAQMQMALPFREDS